MTKTTKSRAIALNNKSSTSAGVQTLDEAHETVARQWVRTNWTAGRTVDPTWHPIIQDEWATLNNAHEQQQRVIRQSAPYYQNT